MNPGMSGVDVSTTRSYGSPPESESVARTLERYQPYESGPDAVGDQTIPGARGRGFTIDTCSG